VFQVVVGTDQPVVIFAQQPYFSVAHTHADPMVTIGTAGENAGPDTMTATLQHFMSPFVVVCTTEINLLAAIQQIHVAVL